MWGFLLTAGLDTASLAGRSSRWQLTVIVTLASLALTASVELYLEVESSRAELRQAQARVDRLENAASNLSPLVGAPPPFQRFAGSVARSRRAAEDSGHPFFRVMFEKAQQEFELATRDIAAGRVEISANASYSFRSAPLTGFRKMRMVHVRDLEFWRSPRGMSYLARQRDAIRKRRLSVYRIFVLSPEQIQRAGPVVAAQIAADIRVRIVRNAPDSPSQISKDAIDFGIIEDIDGAQMIVRLGQDGLGKGLFDAEREILSRRADDIDEHTRQFDRLMEASDPVSRHFPDLAP